MTLRPAEHGGLAGGLQGGLRGGASPPLSADVVGAALKEDHFYQGGCDNDISVRSLETAR